MNINPKNSHLIDIQYVRANKNNNTPDMLYYVYVDKASGEKKLYIEKEPKMDIYIEKPEYRNHTYIRDYQEIKNLEKKEILYKNVIQEIVQVMGNPGKQALQNIYDTRRYDKFRYFHTYPYVFFTDLDIVSRRRIDWALELPEDNDIYKYTRGHFDIEIDLLHYDVHHDFEKCPIDLITLTDTSTKISYTFALVNQEYEGPNPEFLTDKQKRREEIKKKLVASRLQQEKELMEASKDMQKYMEDNYNYAYGDYEYKFFFYEDEGKMITHFFELVNRLKLDFITAWNISFDIPQCIKRLELLGLDPKEIIPHKDFPVKECYFVKDRFSFQPKNKCDYFMVSGYTKWICALNLYANTRKSGKEPRSLKLSDVAYDVLRDKKLCQDGNLKKMAYERYKEYFEYNIKDVLLLDGIESITMDLFGLYNQVLKNATSYEKIAKVTVMITNILHKSYIEQGLIKGNNPNIIFGDDENRSFDDEDDEDESDDETTTKKIDSKFEGALVGHPALNAKVGAKIYGEPSNSVANNAIDMDMSSFYIYTIICHNIAPTTLYFKVLCDANQFKNRGGKCKYNGITDKQIFKENTDTFVDDIAKEIFDNYQTGNILSFGNKFLNLPSVEDVLLSIN